MIEMRCDPAELGRLADPQSKRDSYASARMVGRGRFRPFLLSRSALSCVDYEAESHTSLQRLIQQKVLESDSANRAAIEPIQTDDQQFLAGKGSDKPIELEWRSVTGLHFDPRSALADEIDLVFFGTPEERLQG